jgi:hypothetical protein
MPQPPARGQLNGLGILVAKWSSTPPAPIIVRVSMQEFWRLRRYNTHYSAVSALSRCALLMRF